jgi:hypothetical protein
VAHFLSNAPVVGTQNWGESVRVEDAEGAVLWPLIGIAFCCQAVCHFLLTLQYLYLNTAVDYLIFLIGS